MLPEAKNIVNIVVLGFWGAKNIRISGVFCSESLKKTWKHRLFDDFWPLRDWEKTAGVTADITNNTTTASIWVDFFVSLFFAFFLWWRILHRYASTNRRRLRTETFAQSSFYVQILLHRKVCAQINFYTQTPLHTEVFTQRSLPTEVFYTPMLCTKMHLHA